MPESETKSHDCTDITQSIEQRLQVETINECSVSRKEVMKPINKLKSSKKDCLSERSSNCFREAPISLVEHIAALFSMFLFHGYVPPESGVCR